MNYKKWTNDEVKILNDNSHLYVGELVNLLPHRNKQQIIDKCKRDGINYTTLNKYWSKEDISLLKKNNNKTIQELLLIFPDKNDASIRYNAKNNNIIIIDGQNMWTYEEDEILKNNSNGISTFSEIHNLIPYRSIEAIKSRFCVLGLRIKSSNYKAIGKTKEYRKNHSKRNRYKNLYGIILDKKLMINTYNIIQWWKWVYYGTPSGEILSCVPLELQLEENLKALIKYVITEVVGYKNREDILNLDSKLFVKYKISFHHFFKESVINYINTIFPEYNIRPFELKNVPLGYWQDITNCDEYIEYVLVNEFNVYEMENIKNELPPLFTYSIIRSLGYSRLASCITVNKHYSSFYEWLNKLHPEWGLTSDDFKEYISFDNNKLNSNEEVSIYNIIKKDMKINIIPIGLSKKSKYKFYNMKFDENYIPDFIIKYIDQVIIIEYFGLFKENYGNSKLLKNYYYKTIRKIEFYKSNKDIYFIDLYPNDLKNSFQGVRSKLTSFFMNNFNIDITLNKEVS